MESKWTRVKPWIDYVYSCNHPAYWHCTLYKIKDKGLCVIQQNFCSENKHTWWDCVNDPGLVQLIYMDKGFKEYFDKHAGPEELDGSYPTVTVRQIMHALKMKPFPKEKWETRF